MGMFKKGAQQAELRRAQVARKTGRVNEQTGARLHCPAGEAVRRDRAGGRGSGRRSQVFHSPQQGTDTGQQLTGGKGFDQIIVRADFQPHNPIRQFAQRAEKDDRHAGLRPQAAAEREAVLSGEHDVQQQKRAGFLLQRGLHGGNAGKGPGLETVGCQIGDNLFAQHVVVINDKYEGWILHGASGRRKGMWMDVFSITSWSYVVKARRQRHCGAGFVPTCLIRYVFDISVQNSKVP